MVYVWHVDGTRKQYKTKHTLYTPNRGEYGSMPCGMTDIYGKPVYAISVDGTTERELKNQNLGNRNHLSECDIDFRTRFLQNYYKDSDELRFSMSDINICFLDIEVATKGRFPTAELAEYPVNCVTIYFSRTKDYYTFGLNREIKEETKQKLLENNCTYINCTNEEILLDKLFTIIGTSNTDILTGWNCLDVNGNVWLNNKISKLKNINRKKQTKFDGVINNISTPTIKKCNKITMYNGSYINGSDDHRIPVYIKPIGKYINSNSIYKYETLKTISDIADVDLNKYNVFFKQKLGGNTNKDKTIRDILIDNIDLYLNNSNYNFILTEMHQASKANDVDYIQPKVCKWRRHPSMYTVTKLLRDKVISINTVKEYIKNASSIAYSFKSTYFNDISLDTIVSNEMLHLLGLQYTDGTVWKKDISFTIYNINSGIISHTSDIALNILNNKSNTPILANDGCTSIGYSVRKSIYGLLIPFIYDTDLNKHINTELLSQLSYNQFMSFFSGCIDGDGSVDNGVNLCNYNGADLYEIQELLMWNGVYSTVHNNLLHISSKNNKCMDDLVLYHTIKIVSLDSMKRLMYKDTKSKAGSFYINDDHTEAYIKMRSIDHNGSCEMMDLSTDSHYFTYNSTHVHNCDRFDLPYLYNRGTKLGINHKLLSRLPPNLASVYIGKQDNQLKISATECIDYLLLYKKFTNKERDNYKLDTIGLIEVQERKAPLPDGYQSYIKYWDEFVWYNFKDCELMVKIEAKRRIFESAVAACAEARVPFGAIFEAKKMLVGFIVNYLHKRNIVMPPLRENARETFPGAYVYSTPGYYEDLVSYDYRSMYPSIMMGANISPETKITFPIDYVLSDAEKKLYVRSPWTRNGKVQVYYRRDIVGIVPDVVRVLFDGRTELKKMMKKCKKAGKTDDAVYYDMKQQAYKLFGNSLYGLLGNPYFQFYDIDNSASVTAFGVHLIQATIKRLVHYFEYDFEKLDKFNEMFGFYPSLDRKLFGSFYTEKEETFEFDEEDENNEEFKGSTVYRRMSHGDTDSFFVKYADIYAPYKSFVGKQVGVVVFDGNKMLSNQSFTIENEQKCKQLFNNMCKEHISYWNDAEVDVKRRAFSEGILFDGTKRVIYNRYLLTDFCRILDAGIMEDKLSEIMLDYANYWNYKENTLFLKREKCIIQAIVTAKKKYICYVESNEDEKYLDKKTFALVPNFAITGLEIVRSSSTPFTREHILGLVKDLFKDSDRLVMMERYLAIKKAFYQHVHDKDYYAICIPSGIKTTPPKWDEYIEWPVDKKKSVDWRGRAGSVWNYLIETDPVLSKISLEPVFESSKVKFIKVRPNQYGLKSIAFVGDACPERLLELFTPDWDEQWVKGFAQTMDRLFTAVYGSKNFEKDQREQMCDML